MWARLTFRDKVGYYWRKVFFEWFYAFPPFRAFVNNMERRVTKMMFAKLLNKDQM